MKAFTDYDLIIKPQTVNDYDLRIKELIGMT